MSFLPAALQPNNGVRVSNIEDGLSARTLQTIPGPIDHNAQLATFRHMVGIYSTRELGTTYGNKNGSQTPDYSHNNLHFDGRAAPNLGIYNRVCHREAQAKRGFKFASLLINSCLGIQVVVAAGLTAMGAANTNHSSITVFGAVNTIIAGILTYLKGSGLPNRIRWYENEWKKVREYIEQRERDFARVDCRLDVNQVVQVVEAMYEEVKADIQNNTPEMYISVSEIRARSATVQPNPHVPTLDTLLRKAEHQAQNGLQEAEDRYGHKITEFLEGLAAKEEQRMKKLEVEVEEAKVLALQRGHEVKETGAELSEKTLESASNGLLEKSGEFVKGVEKARVDVLQSEAGLEESVKTLTEEVMQAEHKLKEQAEQVKDDAQLARDRMQSTGDNVQRTAKAVDDEPAAPK